MTEASLVIILAEDVQHQQFIRRYLYRRGVLRHQIDFRPISSGRGSAEYWVRLHYASAVKDYRIRSARARTALVVLIDADTQQTHRRLAQLEEELRNAGIQARASGEAIVHLIPKRNIETWILHLNKEKVDEENDYKDRRLDGLIPSAADTFHQWCSGPPAHCLPSLLAAIGETKRLA